MSDCMYIIGFNRDTVRLEMRFNGDNYETATVRLKIESKDPRQLMGEVVCIPVKNLLDAGYLIGVCLRRVTIQYELEIQEMSERIEQKKHPFKTKGE